jgi:hypothetical protein
MVVKGFGGGQGGGQVVVRGSRVDSNAAVFRSSPSSSNSLLQPLMNCGHSKGVVSTSLPLRGAALKQEGAREAALGQIFGHNLNTYNNRRFF